MKPTTTSGFVALSTENPAMEIEDFERLVAQHRTRVLRFVFASVRDMDLAESLTQDCFWKAYRNKNAFRGDCSVQTWLLKIAINLVRDHVRSSRFRFWKRIQSVQYDDIRNWPDCGISPEERAEVSQRVAAVWEATKTLSERQRTVFFLRYMEDLDVHEIALLTGLSESTVNVHLVRAVRGIRKYLGGMK